MKALKLPKISLSGAPKVRLPKQAQLVKIFFLTRAFREKVLLLGFVILITAAWFTGVVGRAGNFRKNFNMTSTDLESQQGWLTDQASIEAKAKAAVQHLDPAKTFDSLRMQGEIEPLLRQAGITTKYSFESLPSERTSVFTIHTSAVTIREADYASLVKFYLEVVKRTPYIGFSQVNISSTNNKQHTANLRITSVELVGK